MTLVPKKGLLGGVSKLADKDARAAAMLVQIGLFEALTDQINEVRQPMATQVVKNLEAVNARVHAGLSRSVSKGETPAAYAEAIAVMDDFVEKGLIGWIKDQFNREHPRDDRGRFVRYGIRSSDPNAALEQRREGHIANVLSRVDRMKSSGLVGDNTKVMLGMALIDDTGKVSDTIRRQEMKVSEVQHAIIAQGDKMPVEISVARRNLNTMSPAHLAAIDLTALATQQQMPGAANMARGLFDDQGHVRREGENIARDWNTPTEGTNRQSYNRIRMTGQALSGLSAPGSTLSAVGGLAQLMGEIGPEAEKVIGPGIRRTAYRYRGTERRPERELYMAVQRATEYADKLNDPKLNARGREEVLAGLETKGPADAAAIIANTQLSSSISEDQRDLRVRGGAAIATLLGAGRGRQYSRLPDMQLTELSLASGEMPPSEGVIIDARGRVISQAVGYNGDHYLPFDLRNLGALHGGQYVRTRATGGPTTEDIYTALVTGTRQLQVVSNSGVFTVEFDPDLRGARRFNDKVARMIERYGSMLEAIHSPDPKNRLYESDLTPAQKAEVRAEASRLATDSEDFKVKLRLLTDKARFKAQGETPEMEEIEQAAFTRAKTIIDRELAGSREGVSPQERAKMIGDEAQRYITEHRANNPGVRELQLNGEGYHRALRALKQEFPYYIREASFEPLPEWLRNRNMPAMGYRRSAPNEKGYVERGQTNTSQTRQGGFRSARYVQTGRAKPAPVETGAPKGTAKETTTATATPQATGAPRQVDTKALVLNQLTTPLHRLAGYVHAVPPRDPLPLESESDETVLADYSEQHYAHRIVNNARKESRPGAEAAWLVKWLTNASPREQDSFIKGLQNFAKHPDTAANADDIGAKPEQVKALADQVAAAADMLEPFAALPEGKESWAVDPEAKPFDFGYSLPLDATEEDWERAKGNLGLQNDQLKTTIDLLETRTPEQRRKFVEDNFSDYQAANARGNPTEDPKKDVEIAHRAWSFVHARDLTRKMRALVGGEAAPKAPATSAPAGEVGKSALSPLAQLLLDVRSDLDSLLALE